MHHIPAANIPILLISISADKHLAEFKDALLGMGYPVHVPTWSDDLPRECANEVVVCFFHDVPSTRVLHQKFLKLIKSRPVLGIITMDSVKDCEPLLYNCAGFCSWPCELAELEIRIRRIFSKQNKTSLLHSKSTASANPLEILIGKSPEFIESIKQIHRVAPYDAPVLISGETGTGKEIVARAIHYQSPRRDGPFIPINCGALPENLIENELFGHERGAYTDASKSREGLISQASGGTLFLDEIDALQINKGQTVLLRVLEDQEYRPLGSSTTKTADIRVVAATNKRLDKLVDKNEFRADLFYRLNILRIKLPPLRERGRDIKLLSEHFIKCFSAQYGLEKRISTAGLYSLLSHNWPGNVRELQNFLHREYLQQEDMVLGCGSLSKAKGAEVITSLTIPNSVQSNSFQAAKAQAIAQFERQYLLKIIQESCGNISEAARLARKERRALGRLLKKHNIDPASFRQSTDGQDERTYNYK